MAVIKDVAKLAGVSTGTVSNYLNNPDILNENTRIKVENAIKELKYRPSVVARSMRTKKTNMINLIVPDISNAFYTEVYNYIRIAASEAGYTVILYTTEDDIEILKRYLETTESMQQVDGIILCFLDEDEIINQFEEIQSHVPIILMSWDINNVKFNSVVIDVYEGIYNATRHLIELGHERIAYIGGPSNSRISKEKYQGFEKAMKEAEYPIPQEYIFAGRYRFQTGLQAARQLTMLDNPPTAVVAANDVLAIGCIKYLNNKGIKVPDEVAVTGFDNIMLASLFDPPLTTITLPIERMGREAIKLFLQKMAVPSTKNKKTIFKTELIVRNSTVKNVPVDFEF